MPVLAQYGIRSKQDYIFRTNKLLEIVGASAIIRDAWEMLFSCASDLSMYVERADTTDFDERLARDVLGDGSEAVIELFCGGGNETVLIDSRETFIKLNKVFSTYLLEKCPGIIPIAVCVDATENYVEDYSRLMKAAEIEKNRMVTALQEDFVLPFSMMDRTTLKPYTKIRTIEGESVRLSQESWAKMEQGLKEREHDKTVKYLDSMITQKGEESLLAIVHADGNNMGVKIQKMLAGHSGYTECVNLMRHFTKETAKVFGECGINAIEQKCQELLTREDEKERCGYRLIIKDGDDMTFICNARYALEYTTAYLKAVQEYESQWQYSSCAGICIFHSHYPVSKAYEMAEQACDVGAKKMVHVVDGNGKPIVKESGWIDFHYIHSGVGGDLEEIRERHNTASRMGRPWQVTGEGMQYNSYECLMQLDQVMKKYGVARTSIKEIGNEIEKSIEGGRRELVRLCAHKNDPGKGILKDELGSVFGKNEELLLKALYDYAEVYDLWFRRFVR